MNSKTVKRNATSTGRAGNRRRKASDVGGTDKATLQMVALAAGVSPSTVSRILNGTAVVSEDKRAAVDEAIARPP